MNCSNENLAKKCCFSRDLCQNIFKFSYWSDCLISGTSLVTMDFNLIIDSLFFFMLARINWQFHLLIVVEVFREVIFGFLNTTWRLVNTFKILFTARFRLWYILIKREFLVMYRLCISIPPYLFEICILT